MNTANVDRLGLAWAADLPIPDGVATTPIIIDGVVYLSGAYSVVLGLDAKSGSLLWQYDPNVRDAIVERPELAWLGRAHRGIAVWDGMAFLTTADCRLIALDAEQGTHLWTRQTCDNALGYFITDSPYVGGGKVFVGNGGSESQLKGRGYVSAFLHGGRSGLLASFEGRMPGVKHNVYQWDAVYTGYFKDDQHSEVPLLPEMRRVLQGVYGTN
ncbi:MAG: PQQ-binding-like beta-propeller repeat protein [Pseudomonadales bacterium]|nr:PQQ-binding-like beta-propeller repeat protein [Pseudomonadales bacterium]